MKKNKKIKLTLLSFAIFVALDIFVSVEAAKAFGSFAAPIVIGYHGANIIQKFIGGGEK
jgi:hypothetical protein